MADAQQSKDVVLRWLASLGESPEKAAQGVTEDFRWVTPQSASALFPGLPRELRGLEGLKTLLSLDEQIYERGHHGENIIHFVIAEGDRVVIQQEFKTRAKNGRPYDNTYCFTFRVEGDKVAEVWEHADTLHVQRTCFE